jgi:hypothetical protein
MNLESRPPTERDGFRLEPISNQTTLSRLIRLRQEFDGMESACDQVGLRGRSLPENDPGYVPIRIAQPNHPTLTSVDSQHGRAVVYAAAVLANRWLSFGLPEGSRLRAKSCPNWHLRTAFMTGPGISFSRATNHSIKRFPR